MNLELIKHTFLYHEFDSSEQETNIMRGHINDAIKELGEIKRDLGTAIADMNRTGDDEGLQQVYTDLDAFLNPEIYDDEPSGSIIARMVAKNKALSDEATIDAEGGTSKEPDLDEHGHEIDYKKRYEAILEQVLLKSKDDVDVSSLCDGCYNAGLNDAVFDPAVQATIDADGEVAYN